MLKAGQGKSIDFEARLTGADGGTVHWIEDGQEVTSPTSAKASSANQMFALSWVSDGRRHWFRAQVTGPDGKLWLLGNPIYINWDASNDCIKSG
jgi:hypothetical protein